MTKRLVPNDEQHEPRLKAAPPALLEVTDFDSLRRHFRVKVDDWDVFLIGDGSGTTWSKPFGWSCIMIEQGQLERKVFYGGASHGSNNAAELFSVLHAALYLVDRKAGVKPGGCRVHVVSDSQYVVEGLRQRSPIWANETKKNRGLWLALLACRRQGLVFFPHHVPRDQLALQQICHDLANMARLSQVGLANPWSKKVCRANPT